jgi:hypothetical protein
MKPTSKRQRGCDEESVQEAPRKPLSLDSIINIQPKFKAGCNIKGSLSAHIAENSRDLCLSTSIRPLICKTLVDRPATLALESYIKRRRVETTKPSSSKMFSPMNHLFASITACNGEAPFPVIAWDFDDI